MEWVIVKSWHSLPLLMQRATQEVYPTLLIAGQKVEELEKAFPGQVFHIVETPFPSTENTSNGGND